MEVSGADISNDLESDVEAEVEFNPKNIENLIRLQD
jgi:hypothetical protein